MPILPSLTDHPRTGVVVVGSISADLTAYGSPLPRPGETVIADVFSLVLGGKGANQAIAAVRAGAPTWMVGAVGDDLFRELTRGSLADAGVDVTEVAVLGSQTGIAHIRVDRATAQNDIAVIPLANGLLTPELAVASLERLSGKVSAVLLQLEIPLDTVIATAQAARALGLTTILDPAPAAELPEEIWSVVDVVTPNETEASDLTGIEVTDFESAELAARWFIERGAGAAVVSLAERGALALRADLITRLEPLPVVAVDTTAAGDAFTGMLGVGLASGLDWETCLLRASAAGALAVTVRGASPSLPTAAQVDAFLATQTP